MSERIRVTCTDNDRVVDATLVSRSAKRLVVSLALGAASVELVLTRHDLRRPFVGRYHGMEFTAAADTWAPSPRRSQQW
jgi:hypothetical protein